MPAPSLLRLLGLHSPRICLIFLLATFALAEETPNQVNPITPLVSDSSLGPDSSFKATTQDTVAKDSITTGVFIYEYIANPTLQLLTWPVENILAPVVKALIYPTLAPIQYALEENVLDRTLTLLAFGKQNQVLLYPTLDVAPGTSSRIGLTMIHNAPFGRKTERFSLRGLICVNGDKRIRSNITFSQLLGTDWNSRFDFSANYQKNRSINQPGTPQFLYFSDTSYLYRIQLAHPIFGGVQARSAVFYRHGKLGRAPPNKDDPFMLQSDFFFNPTTGLKDSAYRGLNQTFVDRGIELGLGQDSRNNENIPLIGSRSGVNLNYHDVANDHDYYDFQAFFTKYFKLGSERYEITAEEERRMKGPSFSRFIRELEYEKLKQKIFSRKVLVMHIVAAQSFEMEGNSIPIYGLQSLGNDTPLRGYAGSRFRDYAVAGINSEYRFPVMRIVDGAIFNEYGVYGRSLETIDYFNVKNSWGFGIHVRRPDIHLIRAELGFHGLSGMAFNLGVEALF